MERLKSMKNCLMSAAEAQMANLNSVDAKELGEVIDMIKDLEEAIYYCTVVKAMEEGGEKKEESMQTAYNHVMPESRYYYHERIREPYVMGGQINNEGYGNNRMYYDGSNSSSGNSGMSSGSNSSSSSSSNGTSYYHEREWPDIEMRDWREGRSPISRRMYMETKEMNKDGNKELEQYMKELSEDITEMVQDASMEERQMLQKKLALLAQKITAND